MKPDAGGWGQLQGSCRSPSKALPLWMPPWRAGGSATLEVLACALGFLGRVPPFHRPLHGNTTHPSWPAWRGWASGPAFLAGALPQVRCLLMTWLCQYQRPRWWHREVDPCTSLSDCPFSPSLSFLSWLDPRVGLDGAGMESLSPVSLQVEGEISSWTLLTFGVRRCFVMRMFWAL